MVTVRRGVHVLAVSILLVGLVLIGSSVMTSGAASRSGSSPVVRGGTVPGSGLSAGAKAILTASGAAVASPSSCYPPGSTRCPGKLKVSPSTVVRGAMVEVTGSGFKAGAKVSVNVCNFETVSTRANSSGHISVRITIPDTARVGACKFTATGLGANDQTLTLTATVTVKIASKTFLRLSATRVTSGHEQVEHLSVSVWPLYRGPARTGTVVIKESATTLCRITLRSDKGSCTLSARRLSAGTYHLVATYGGSLTYRGSASARETLTVTK
jgi:hypothetical protein